jgi:NADH-quinone oxidoreductase subunit C
MNQVIIERLQAKFPSSIRATEEFRDELTVTIRTADLVPVAHFLKDDPALAFAMLIDIVGVDRFREKERFEVNYMLYSLAHKGYLRLKVLVEESEATVPTLTGVWPSANWHERETFDMFGIKFAGHPDLRRFYMPEEFEYYPLRKDFPLTGIPDSLPLPRR